jgi:hypothetical protein
MTRRLITLDLTFADYLAFRKSVVHSLQSFSKREAAKCETALAKLDDAWDAKGREGRGLNTKLPRRE